MNSVSKCLLDMVLFVLGRAGVRLPAVSKASYAMAVVVVEVWWKGRERTEGGDGGQSIGTECVVCTDVHSLLPPFPHCQPTLTLAPVDSAGSSLQRGRDWPSSGWR